MLVSLIHCTFGNDLVQVIDLSRELVLVGSLNGVVSLVTVYEEFSCHVLFCHVTR